MLKNREYKMLYRNLIRKDANRKRKNTLWLDQRSEKHIQIMAALFFIGFLLTIAYGFKTLLTWGQISQLFFGCAVIFSLLPVKILPVIYRIRKELKIILGVGALAPFVTGLVLMLNFHFSHVYEIQTTKVIYYQFQYSERIIMVDIENKILNKHLEIRKFSLDKFNFEPDSAAYEIHKGFMGIKSVNKSWLIPKKDF